MSRTPSPSSFITCWMDTPNRTPITNPSSEPSKAIAIASTWSIRRTCRPSIPIARSRPMSSSTIRGGMAIAPSATRGCGMEDGTATTGVPHPAASRPS